MIFFESFLVAMSTYSVIPMPQFQWNERNMKYALCFFPVVGAVISAFYLLWCWISSKLNVSPVLFAAVAAAIPLIISGGIHMDGFMDTVDAVSSHQTRERKLEILKDPNCGAFAVIYCGVYMLGFFGLMYEAYINGCAGLMAFAFPLSRSLSGLLAMTMPNARKGGMLYAFTKDSERKKAAGALLIMGALTAALMLFLVPTKFIISLILNLLWVFIYKAFAMKQFGGATGDTAGFFLQVSEILFLAGLWLGSLII